MGHSVSVDRDLVWLKDLLSLGQAEHDGTGGASVKPGPHLLGSARHHVKVWQFEKEGRKVVDSPVLLCDENGEFSAELAKTSSYLILHVQALPALAEASSAAAAAAAAAVVAEEEGQQAASAVLEELTASATACCTPRGLALEVAASQPQSEGPHGVAAAAATSLRCAVFAWHGLQADPHVKARALTKAFELERMIRLGLVGRRRFQKTLQRAVELRGVAFGASPGAGAGTLPSPRKGRRSRNRLAEVLLEPAYDKAYDDSNGYSQALSPSISGDGGDGTPAAFAGVVRYGSAPAAGCSGREPKFPRLARSVWRSLHIGGSPGGGAPDSFTSAWPTSDQVPSWRAPLHRGTAPTGAVGTLGGSATAPLAAPVLGNLLCASATPGPAAGAAGAAAPPAEAAAATLSPRPAAEAAAGRGSGAAPAAPPPAVALTTASGGGSPPATSPVPGPGTGGGGLGGAPALVVPRLALGLGGLNHSDAGRPATNGGSLTAPSHQVSPRPATVGASPARPRVDMPALNLAAVKEGATAAANRGDNPPALILEDIGMHEEDVGDSSNQANEESNNYHMMTARQHMQHREYRQVLSEVVPGTIYLSSCHAAGDLALLKRHCITHIVNTAADGCGNLFPEHFSYLTYYLKDANTEDISLVLCRTLEWMQAAVSRGGRVLVHCLQGISRSATVVIAYLMWRFALSFEAAHERVLQVRPICNPNPGFTFHLLLFGKKLGVDGSPPPNSNLANQEMKLFRVVPYHEKEPFLLLLPTDWPRPVPFFDPRFGWVLQVGGTQFLLWMGSMVPDPAATKAATLQHARWAETFDRLGNCPVTVIQQGAETAQLWQAVGLQGTPADQANLAAPKPTFDRDYEIMRVSVAGA